MFILLANLLGLLPLGLVGLHPFTFTSHFTATGVLAIMSFSIVQIGRASRRERLCQYGLSSVVGVSLTETRTALIALQPIPHRHRRHTETERQPRVALYHTH